MNFEISKHKDPSGQADEIQTGSVPVADFYIHAQPSPN